MGQLWHRYKAKGAVWQIIFFMLLSYILLALFRLGGDLFLSEGGAAPLRYLELQPLLVYKRPWTLLSYMWVHQDLFHLLFNMAGLLFFGIPLQRYLGNRRFWLSYLEMGVGVGLLYTFIASLLLHWGGALGSGYAIVGSSSAVLAVAFALSSSLPWIAYPIFRRRIGYLFFALLLFVGGFLLYPSNMGGHLIHLLAAIWGGALGYLLRRYRFYGVIDRLLSEGQRRRVSGRDLDRLEGQLRQSGYRSLSREEQQQLIDHSDK